MQIQAVSNYRQHPFVVALGHGGDGVMLEVASIANWIQEETGTSVDGIGEYKRFFFMNSRNLSN